MKLDPLIFPILYSFKGKPCPTWPDFVPWKMIEPFEHQAKHNHSQSLKRLAERGGLSPLEMYAVFKEIDWPELRKLGMTNDEQAIYYIKLWLEEVKMESNLFREIVETSDDGLITVSRHRNSLGSCAIIVKVAESRDVAGRPIQITLQSKSQTDEPIMTGEDPGDYERRAQELAEMLLRIVKDKCELP